MAGGRGGRGVVGAALGALSVTAPEVGIPLAIGVGIAHELQEVPRHLRDFAEHLASANRELAPYSGRLAQAQMRFDVGEFFRRRDLAARTEETGETLLHAVGQMRDALQPWNVAIRNIQNEAAIGAAGLVSGAAERLGFIPGAVEAARRWMDPQGTGMEQFAERIGQGIVDAIAQGTAAMAGGPLGGILSAIFPNMGQQIIDQLNKWFPAAAVQGQLGPWDEFAKDLLMGRVPAGPILPKAGRRPLPPLIGGGAIDFGKGV